MSLPFTKQAAKTVNPKQLLIFGKPKVGKTEALANLPDGSLIIDLEGFTDYYDCTAAKATTWDELIAVYQKLVTANKAVNGKAYPYIAIDSVSRLEELVEKKISQDYIKDNPKFNDTSVVALPHGKGFHMIREKLGQILNMFADLCEYFIIVGHVKDKNVTTADDQELGVKEIDLYGKMGRILSSHVGAIGYLYRKDGDLWIKFKGDEEGAVVGSPCKHLAGQEFIFKPKEASVWNWGKIYL